MKKILVQMTALLLALLMGLSVAAEETTQLNILWAEVEEQTVTVVYRLVAPQQKQRLTCLVYDGKGDTLLWAGQFDAAAGIGVEVFPASQGDTAYQVHLGGDGVRAPRKITVDSQTGYRAAGLSFGPGDTVGQVMATLQGLGDPALFRDASPLGVEEPVAPGDRLTATDMGALALWTVIYGDVNLDGKITAADALAVLRYTVGKATFTDVALAAADWVQNRQISAATALTILQFSVGKIAAF